MLVASCYRPESTDSLVLLVRNTLTPLLDKTNHFNFSTSRLEQDFHEPPWLTLIYERGGKVQEKHKEKD